MELNYSSFYVVISYGYGYDDQFDPGWLLLRKLENNRKKLDTIAYKRWGLRFYNN